MTQKAWQRDFKNEHSTVRGFDLRDYLKKKILLVASGDDGHFVCKKWFRISQVGCNSGSPMT